MKPILLNITFLFAFIGLSSHFIQAQCSPTLREIYDFEVGDQFFYRETYQQDDVGGPYYTYWYEDYKITDKISNGDTLQFIRLSNTNSIDTLFFIDSANHALNRCFYITDTTLPYCGSFWSLDHDFIRIYRTRDSTNRKYKLFGTRSISEIFTPDSLGFYDFELSDFKGFSHECYSIYLEGIGLLSQGTFTFESGRYYELQKFIRGTDTLSITLNNRTPLVPPSVTIYPNPTTNHCCVKSSNQIKNIVVSSISGQFQARIDLENSSNEVSLNTSTLSPGVYSLLIETDSGFVIKKLVKL